MMAKVIKAELNQHLGDKEKKIILFENQKISEKRFEKELYMNDDSPESIAHGKIELEVRFYVKLGDKIYKRDYTRRGNYFKINCLQRERKIIKINPAKIVGNVIVLIEKEDFELPLLRKIKEIERGFCLIEEELLSEAYNLINKKYKWKQFKSQVEIDRCIADGLVFLGKEGSKKTRIIGFEAKTNKDNYDRLYNQLNAYLSICDETYLIIEDKEPPADLPFFVGIIKVEKGKSEIIRDAQNLKHSIDSNEYWGTLLGSLNVHVGLRRNSTEIRSFFEAVESIKRKLIWNQFVVGFNQSYVDEYIPLTEKEKRIIRSYFGKESSKLIKEYE